MTHTEMNLKPSEAKEKEKNFESRKHAQGIINKINSQFLI